MSYMCRSHRPSDHVWKHCHIYIFRASIKQKPKRDREANQNKTNQIQRLKLLTPQEIPLRSSELARADTKHKRNIYLSVCLRIWGANLNIFWQVIIYVISIYWGGNYDHLEFIYTRLEHKRNTHFSLVFNLCQIINYCRNLRASYKTQTQQPTRSLKS